MYLLFAHSDPASLTNPGGFTALASFSQSHRASLHTLIGVPLRPNHHVRRLRCSSRRPQRRAAASATARCPGCRDRAWGQEATCVCWTSLRDRSRRQLCSQPAAGPTYRFTGLWHTTADELRISHTTRCRGISTAATASLWTAQLWPARRGSRSWAAASLWSTAVCCPATGRVSGSGCGRGRYDPAVFTNRLRRPDTRYGTISPSNVESTADFRPDQPAVPCV